MNTWKAWKWRSVGSPQVALGFYLNQCLFGVMLDRGHIVPVRWIVVLIGPFTFSVTAGRWKE